MVIVRELRPNIYSLVALDWHGKIFAEPLPLPEGSSDNADLDVPVSGS